jgi:hypothetical protein
MKLGVRESVVSCAVFVGVLVALSMVDPLVRDRLAEVFRGGVAPWSDRVGDLGGALWSAARYHSIDSAPMLVFAAVGAVLTLFMLRT